ncbi:MAG: 4-hydroxyphenylacetate 3-hydroxylase family protein [Chloroflexi bacterium]|nr:4-hydroxyphenylacetate 3-hydroxylase family protein [Chloroflexota bacterium]
MRTSKDYLEALKAMRHNVYLWGEKVDRPYEHPQIRTGVNVISLTYDMAQDPRYEGLLTAKSHLSGEKINRFTHIHQSPQDLMAKVQMTRVYCQQTGGCIQRCMGIDALNSLSIVTYDMDKQLGTSYYERLLRTVRRVQDDDLTLNAAMTDVKGDRSLKPHEQEDPDMYLRVVERKADGIVVRGAKAHNTLAPYAEELVVLPTRALGKEDADYAVAFVIPADAPGITLICRASSPAATKRMESPVTSRYGFSDSLTVFDDVFVPWERVLMCGEWHYAGILAGTFANYHRHSYCGCKPGIADILLGSAALAADYNGVGRASHIRSKLVDMITTAEMVYACGITASVNGQPMPSGTYLPDTIYSNAGKYFSGTNLHHEYEIVHDIAGGLIATLPSEADYFNPGTGDLMRKYLKGRAGVTTDDRLRCFRLIEDLTVSRHGAMVLVAGVHGGGSPEAEKVAIWQNYDLEGKKALAKKLARIEE